MARVVLKRGSSCRFDELAADLAQQRSSGAFRGRTAAGRMFGLVVTQGSDLTLTDLGMRVCSPSTEAEALAEAFLNIDLYESLYARYAAEGGKLPQKDVIEADIMRLNVAPQNASKARQIFMRSAEDAGFFRSGRDRLIRPSAGNGSITARHSAVPKETAGVPHAEAEPMAEPSLMQGLVAMLPPEGERFTPKQRQRWLEAAERILDLIYAGDDEELAPASAGLNGVPSAHTQRLQGS